MGGHNLVDDRQSQTGTVAELGMERDEKLLHFFIGHADSYPILAHYLAILERGANLEFDFIGMPWERERVSEARTLDLVCELLARGHTDRIFLSQDVCSDPQLTAFGGNGYAYLSEGFLPRLRAAGVSDAEIETMTVANPRRLLTVG